MVPGSTLRYGSNFMIVTRIPRSTRSRPIDAAAIPLPSDETTPPVTKMYRVCSFDCGCIGLPSCDEFMPPRVRAAQIVFCVDSARRRLLRNRNTDGNSVRKRAELLESLGILEWMGRKRNPAL